MEPLVSFFFFPPTFFSSACLLGKDLNGRHPKCHKITVWNLESTRLCKKHILTLTTLHNHVHQVQSFSTSFHLQYDTNFYMSWQLKTLSEAIMCFSWHQVSKSHSQCQRFSMNLDRTAVRNSSEFCASHSSFQIQKENQGAIISFPISANTSCLHPVFPSDSLWLFLFFRGFIFSLLGFLYVVKPGLHFTSFSPFLMLL